MKRFYLYASIFGLALSLQADAVLAQNTPVKKSRPAPKAGKKVAAKPHAKASASGVDAQYLAQLKEDIEAGKDDPDPKVKNSVALDRKALNECQKSKTSPACISAANAADAAYEKLEGTEGDEKGGDEMGEDGDKDMGKDGDKYMDEDADKDMDEDGDMGMGEHGDMGMGENEDMGMGDDMGDRGGEDSPDDV